jgi:NAD(P)-dependent dehydrogenase (short-subunit alcohol dehydrogenase family)
MPQTRRVALVTGCSEPESLGASLALSLLGRGYKVYTTARKLESMKQLEGAGCEVSGALGSCSWDGTDRSGPQLTLAAGPRPRCA